MSQALTNAKASQAKQANLHHALQPQHKITDKVLLSTKNIKFKNISPKIKLVWIGPLTILSATDNRNNYSLDLSSDPSLNLTYNTFHISKVKPCVNNNSILFLQRQIKKQWPVSQDRYEVEKVIEYYKAPRTGVQQYKVH